jgi:predicted DNA binding CopG/RHH family protein
MELHRIGAERMSSLCIRMDERDLEAMRKKAAELRIPPTIYARSLIIRGMKDDKNTGEQMNEK